MAEAAATPSTEGHRRAIVLVISDRFSEADRQKRSMPPRERRPWCWPFSSTVTVLRARPRFDREVERRPLRADWIGHWLGKVLKKLLRSWTRPGSSLRDSVERGQAKSRGEGARKGTKVRMRPAGLD